MAILCFAYFIGVATCLTAAGLLVEQALPASAPRRWIWSLVIPASIVLPIVFSLHHSAPAVEIWGYTVLQLPRHDMGAGAHSMAGPDWFDCSRATYGMFLIRMSGIWTMVLMLWALASAVRVWYLLGNSHARIAIVDGVPAVVTDALGPAAIGILRRRILLPRWVLALPGAQRGYVVRHEDEHRKAHDPLLLGAASILVAVFAWILPLWWQLRRLRLAIETDCDRRVVANLGDAHAYGALLFRVAEATSRTPGLQPALAGRAGTLETRLRFLVAPTERGWVYRSIAVTLATALVYLVLAVPHPIPR